MTLIAVQDSQEFHHQAVALADTLQVPLVSDTVGETAFRFLLIRDQAGLALQQTGKRVPGPVRSDFVAGAANHRRLYGGGKSQAIARAVGISSGFKPRIADLTAGLGRDSFVLAGLGATVSLVERHPVIYQLLADGFRRALAAGEKDAGLKTVLSRMSLTHCDALAWMDALDPASRPEVILLDPMFPKRSKSAEVKKEMSFFQQLVGGDPDSAELLERALDRAVYRVVVKRSAHAPELGGHRPGYSLQGKSTRFDIYPLRKMPTSR